MTEFGANLASLETLRQEELENDTAEWQKGNLPQQLANRYDTDIDALDPALLILLEDMAIKQYDSHLAIQGEHGEFYITETGAVGFDTTQPIDSPDSINAYLEGAEIYSTIHDHVFAGGETEEQRLMAQMCAELNGVEVKNASEKTLADVNPELAQKVQEAWEARQTEKGLNNEQAMEANQSLKIHTWDQVEPSSEALNEKISGIVVNGGDSNLTGVQKAAGEGLGVVARKGMEPMIPDTQDITVSTEPELITRAEI